MIYADKALGRDLSHYDTITIEDVRGLDFLICKMGGSENDSHSSMGNPYMDEKFNGYVQMAWDLDIPCGAYWFVGPRVYLEGGMTTINVQQCTDENHPVMSQILRGMHAGTGWKGINFLAFDVEEASKWIDLPYKVDPFWMTFYLEDLRGRIVKRQKAGTFPDIPLGIYSRKSWVDAWDGPDANHNLSTFLANHPEWFNWTANYPRNIPAVPIASVRANWLPLDTWKSSNFTARMADFWQFDDSPDLNLYAGTPAELRAWCKYKSHAGIPQPPPTTDPTLAQLAARVAALEAWKEKPL